MASNAFVRARIDERLKNEAAAVLSELGLTVSDVVRITLTRIAKDKALMAAKRAGFSKGQELIDDLDGKVR